jgi:hypothetical protein
MLNLCKRPTVKKISTTAKNNTHDANNSLDVGYISQMFNENFKHEKKLSVCKYFKIRLIKFTTERAATLELNS